MNPQPSTGSPQDTTPSYRAPIPPVGEHDASDQQRSEPRYLKSEPLPNSPFSQFGGFGGASTRAPYGAQYGAPLGAGLRLPRKSLPMAGVLALLLGPLGMVYSTIFGAFIMTGVIFWTAIFTAFQAVPFVWLFGVFWAVSAAHRRNRMIELVEQRLAA